MSVNKGFAGIVLIILVVGFIGLGVYVVLDEMRGRAGLERDQLPDLGNRSLVREWQTYKSEEYGFEFEYPKGLMPIETQGHDELLTVVFYDEETARTYPESVARTDIKPYLRLSVWPPQTGDPSDPNSVLYSHAYRYPEKEPLRLFQEKKLTKGADALELSAHEKYGNKVAVEIPRGVVEFTTQLDAPAFAGKDILGKVKETFVISNPAAGWKTYEDSQYGFSFQYPPSFKVESAKIFGQRDLFKHIVVLPPYKSWDRIELQVLAGSQPNPDDTLCITKQVLFGKKGIPLAQVSCGDAGSSGSVYYVPLSKDVYIAVRVSLVDGGGERGIPELQIRTFLDSFDFGAEVFTDNWKTYRNEEYGFEFQYPPDFVEHKYSTHLEKGAQVVFMSGNRTTEGKPQYEVVVQASIDPKTVDLSTCKAISTFPKRFILSKINVQRLEFCRLEEREVHDALATLLDEITQRVHNSTDYYDDVEYQRSYFESMRNGNVIYITIIHHDFISELKEVVSGKFTFKEKEVILEKLLQGRENLLINILATLKFTN